MKIETALFLMENAIVSKNNDLSIGVVHYNSE